MSKPLNIGMVGYGFMGRTHSNAYRKVTNFFKSEYQPVLKAVCARDAAKVKEFADNWGYESVETDWRKLVERKDIDAIDICTPNNLHHDIAIAAAANGKMILCEKPLSMNAEEGEAMCQAVEKAGSIDVDKVRKAVYGQKILAPGGEIMMDQGNHHTHKPVLIGEILKDGQFKIVSRSKGLVKPEPWSEYTSPDKGCDWISHQGTYSKKG